MKQQHLPDALPAVPIDGRKHPNETPNIDTHSGRCELSSEDDGHCIMQDIDQSQRSQIFPASNINSPIWCDHDNLECYTLTGLYDINKTNIASIKSYLNKTNRSVAVEGVRTTVTLSQQETISIVDCVKVSPVSLSMATPSSRQPSLWTWTYHIMAARRSVLLCPKAMGQQ